MTETHPGQFAPSLWSIAESLRHRWLRWRAFENLVFELRTNTTMNFATRDWTPSQDVGWPARRSTENDRYRADMGSDATDNMQEMK